ncbi:hypothetical protein prwr041_22540 [Prevotella herbatica]|uniref:Fibrobacter succinogenes major paralogous domain-containing protein n=1 Tax=Prevotella herbatica TaxID=2801997 RepID=A0ABN6ENB8_9BACT|nr:hypothetical protein prwr041_22540 [Prevotella herbatica]
MKLTFCISDGNQTRAINTTNENIVSDITVMIFDTSGSLIGSTYQSSVAAGSVSVPVTTRSASNCKIYAIANTGSSSYFAGVNTVDKLNTMYTTITNAADLENNGSTAGSTGAMMIGHIDVPTIDPGTNQFAIPLYHQCGKVTFTITPASGVTITGYQLCNVPLSSYITDSHVPASASVVAGPPAGASSYGNFTAVSSLSQTTALSKTYYVYENLCGSNSNATTEVLRNSSNVPVSASASASYLLVNAKGSGWSSTYRIYLGGVTNVATPATDLTNFNVYRNLSYQCNISLGANGGNGDARVTYQATITSGRSNMYMGDAPIGNYLYDDGTNGSAYSPNHTVGLIFSSEVTQAQYNDGCRHGRAIALKDAYNGSPCAWSSNSTPNNSPYPDKTVHPYCQAFSTCFNDVSSGYDAASSAFAGLSSNPAWYYCNIYSDGTTHTGSLLNRKWYLPSAGDWWDIMENLCTWTDPQKTTIKGMRISSSGITTIISGLSGYYSTFDTKLTAAGGTALKHTSYYWAASEYDGGNVVIVYFNPSAVILYSNGKGVSNGYCVRAVLAY